MIQSLLTRYSTSYMDISRECFYPSNDYVTKLLSIYLDSSKLGFLFCHLQIMFKLLMHFHGRQNAKNVCKIKFIEQLTVDDDAANVIITPKSNLAQVLEFEALLMLVCSNKILFRNCIHKHKRTIM